MVIETPRLIIREFAAHEEHLLLSLGQDERVTRFTTPRTEAETSHLFNQILKRYTTLSRYGRWAVINKEDEAFAGTCVLTEAREGLKGMEIGYMLHYQYWGKGLATEIVKALVSYGLRWGLPKYAPLPMPKTRLRKGYSKNRV